MNTKQTFNLVVTKPDGNEEAHSFNGGSLINFCKGIGLGYNQFHQTLASDEGTEVKRRYPTTNHKWPIGSVIRVVATNNQK